MRDAADALLADYDQHRIGRRELLAGLLALGGRSRAAAVAGGGLILAGELALRWSIYKAGFQSARAPKYTVVPQKARKAQRGAATTAARGSRNEPRS